MKNKHSINAQFIGGIILIISFFIASGSIQMKVESAANVFKWYLLIGTLFWTLISFLFMFGKMSFNFKKKHEELTEEEKVKTVKTIQSNVNQRALLLGTGVLIFNELSKIQTISYFNLLSVLAIGFLYLYFYKKRNKDIF